MKILLGVTSSVAGVLVPKLYRMLTERKHEVKVVLTERAKYFLEPSFLAATPYSVFTEWYDDKSEYPGTLYEKDQPIPHIDLREWADVFLVCPASANTMAKFANGICDNLLTSVFRAWDFRKPVYVAGAMNTKMWLHPVTESHLETLKRWGVHIIYPTVKKLACGEYGVGGVADLETIVSLTEGYKWVNPFGNQPVDLYIPVSPHPGSFGVARHFHVHTGVDLYADVGTHIYAFESGEVVSMGQFTGAAVDCGWWNDTWYVSVKGQSGIICYGEIEINSDRIEVGSVVTAGQTQLGRVLQVVKDKPKKPVPHHKCSMLHVELLRPIRGGVFTTPDWDIGADKPKEIVDPTPYLYLLEQQ